MSFRWQEQRCELQRLTSRCRTILLLLLVAGLVLVRPALVSAATFQGDTTARQRLAKLAFADLQNHWAREAVLDLAVRGIFRGLPGGIFAPDQALTREEALVLLLRLVGREAEAQTLAADDLAAASSRWSDGYLALARDQGWLTDLEAPQVEVGRQEPAQRQEVAVWTARALGLAPVWGVDQLVLEDFSDQEGLDSSRRALVAALVQEGLLSGTAPGRLAPREAMTRSEMAVFLARISPRVSGGPVVGEIVARQVEKGLQGVIGSTWLVRTPGGDYHTLREEGNTSFIVHRLENWGLASLLQVGDAVTFQQETAGVVRLVIAQPPRERQLSGTFLNWTGSDQLELATIEDQRLVLGVAPKTEVWVENRIGSLRDLLPGQPVTVTIREDQVWRFKARLPAASSQAYLLPGEEKREGRVRQWDGYYLVLRGPGGDEVYPLDSGVPVARAGQALTKGDLVPGQMLRLTLRENRVAAVEVAVQNTGQVELYRGRLAAAYPSTHQLALAEVQRMVWGYWQPEAAYLVLPLAPDAELFLAGGPVGLKDLAAWGSDQVVYLIAGQRFGRQEVLQVVQQAGEERVLNGPLSQVTTGGHRLRLGDNLWVAEVGPGSLLVREGNPVVPGDLQPGEQVFMVANRLNDAVQAAAVLSESVLPDGVNLFRGYLHEVGQEELRLDGYSRLHKLDWDNPDGTRRRDFQLAWDARVLDATQPNVLSLEDLLASRWDGQYDDWAVYLVEEAGRARAVSLWPEDLADSKTSLGRVVTMDDAGGRLDLVQVRDWSEPLSRWLDGETNLSLDVSAALVWRGKRLAAWQDLRQGDTVLVVHDHDRAYLVLAREGSP